VPQESQTVEIVTASHGMTLYWVWWPLLTVNCTLTVGLLVKNF